MQKFKKFSELALEFISRKKKFLILILWTIILAFYEFFDFKYVFNLVSYCFNYFVRTKKQNFLGCIVFVVEIFRLLLNFALV